MSARDTWGYIIAHEFPALSSTDTRGVASYSSAWSGCSCSWSWSEESSSSSSTVSDATNWNTVHCCLNKE